MKNNVVIIHGSFGSPYSNWFPWLNKELEEQGKNVLVPSFPIGVGLQTYENWSKLMDYYQNLGYFNETTTVIGHSIAPVFICHYFIEHQIYVKKLIFVSGFNNYAAISDENYNQVNASMFCDNVEKIQEFAKDIICFYSDNDPYTKESTIQFFELVGNKLICLKGKEHINAESGFTKFTEILPYL